MCALRVVSVDKLLCFRDTFIIIKYASLLFIIQHLKFGVSPYQTALTSVHFSVKKKEES